MKKCTIYYHTLTDEMRKEEKWEWYSKTIQEEFDYCYIVDTQSDVRANPKIAGTTHNVFGIQTGVAVMFLIKTKNNIN